MEYNNSHHRTIHLVQHTPMWHFQPDQAECCLRASEVKPKLDKFLKLELDEKKRYKMSFEAIGKKASLQHIKKFTNKRNEVKETNLYPLFFGNIGDKDAGSVTKKALVCYPEGVKMTLFSFDENLLNRIEQNLCRFFACTNFGTRQDKGFGCFYPKAKGGKSIGYKGEEADYVFQVKDLSRGRNGEYPELFQFIHFFHKMIRSGVNQQNHYYKSFMYFYALSKNETWDKPVIRHNFQMYNSVYHYICGIPVTDSRLSWIP